MSCTRLSRADFLQSGGDKGVQERTDTRDDDDRENSETLVIAEEKAISANGPGRIRTCDRAIMSRKSSSSKPLFDRQLGESNEPGGALLGALSKPDPRMQALLGKLERCSPAHLDRIEGFLGGLMAAHRDDPP